MNQKPEETQETQETESGERSPEENQATPQPTFVWLEPDSAQENPLQWRKHDELQLSALEELIHDKDSPDHVGWAKPIVINDRKVERGWTKDLAVPTLVDGHGRVSVAINHPGEQVPAMIGQWNPHQEAILIRFLDPLSTMAGVDLAQIEMLDQELALSVGILDDLHSDFKRHVAALKELDQPEFPDMPEVDEGKAGEMLNYLIKVEVKENDQYEEIAEAILDLIEDRGFDAVIKS